MYYCGIDYHKRYSVASVQDPDGKTVMERRIEHNNPFAIQEFFRQLDTPTHVVYESGLNWTWLHDLLSETPNIASITLANAYKIRLIAEAQIKTDKLDARKLAMLGSGMYLKGLLLKSLR
jgi:hypothetical protein